MACLRTSSLNLKISLSICQKYGFKTFFFCANKLDKPFRLPHSHPWPWSKLTENDISDVSISTPRLSKNSIIFGYVTCPISQSSNNRPNQYNCKFSHLFYPNRKTKRQTAFVQNGISSPHIQGWKVRQANSNHLVALKSEKTIHNKAG